MPKITPGDVHFSRPLSNIMIAHYQGATTNWIADRVFPNIPTQFQADKYYKFGRKSFLQTRAAKRAPGTESRGVDWNFTIDQFFCDTYALHHDIDDQLRANADSNFRLDRNGTTLITQQMMLRREKEFINSFFKTGVWDVDMAGVAAAPAANQFISFDNTASSPIDTFRQIRRSFHKRTGVLPNTAVFGPDAWDTLVDHPEIIERVKYTQPTVQISPNLVSQAIGIPSIHIADAVEADDEEELVADVTPDTEYLADDSVLVCYTTPTPAQNIPSAGYTFSWNGYLGASAFGGRVKKFRQERINSDRIEIECSFAMKVVAPELGTFLTNVKGA